MITNIKSSNAAENIILTIKNNFLGAYFNNIFSLSFGLILKTNDFNISNKSILIPAQYIISLKSILFLLQFSLRASRFVIFVNIALTAVTEGFLIRTGLETDISPLAVKDTFLP